MAILAEDVKKWQVLHIWYSQWSQAYSSAQTLTLALRPVRTWASVYKDVIIGNITFEVPTKEMGTTAK